jgi:hypothetical protein
MGSRVPGVEEVDVGVDVAGQLVRHVHPVPAHQLLTQRVHFGAAARGRVPVLEPGLVQPFQPLRRGQLRQLRPIVDGVVGGGFPGPLDQRVLREGVEDGGDAGQFLPVDEVGVAAAVVSALNRHLCLLAEDAP